MSKSHDITSLDISNLLMREMIKFDPKFKITTYMEEFKKIQTNPERIDFVYRELQKHNLLPTFIKDKKSDEVSIGHHERANGSLEAGRYLEALEIYTSSISEAKSKHALGLAYASRAKCLFRMNLHKECLMDIERALSNNYPNNLKPELITLRENAKKFEKNWKYHEDIPVIPENEKHPILQSSSNCIEIKTNEEFGRHVIATKDIQIGDVISVETPFSNLLTNQLAIHCAECTRLCYNLIPCKKCTQAWYCSENCLEKAQIYHRYECVILLSLFVLKIENSVRFALKVAFLAKEYFNEMDSYEIEENEIYQSHRFKEMYCLGNCPDHRPVSNLHSKAALSALAYHLVKKHTNFFNGPDKEKIEYHFKDCLLYLNQICTLNGTKISELYPSLYGIYESEAIGGSVYPLLTFYNHSCCPNVGKLFYGDTLVLRAIRTIKKGEQCFVNYSTHYLTEDKKERQEILMKQYGFTCNCIACRENWVPLPASEVPPTDSILKEIDPDGYLILKEKLLLADVKNAKKLIFYLVPQYGQAEETNPGRAHVLRELIFQCYKILGNKRRI